MRFSLLDGCFVPCFFCFHSGFKVYVLCSLLELGAGLLVAGMASGPQGVSFKAGSWWLGQGTKEEGELWIVSESTERVGEVCRWVDCLGFWWLA